MRSILLVTTILLILPVTPAWSVEDKDDAGNRISGKNNEAASDAVESAVNEVRGMDEFSSYPRREDLKGGLESLGLSDYDRDPADRYKYMVKIKIDELIWPRNKLGYTSEDNNMILIGVPRPSYRLKGNPYIKGRMDLRIGGSLFGLESAGLFTLGYDFRSDSIIGRISSSFRLDKVSYSLIMHFDGP